MPVGMQRQHDRGNVIDLEDGRSAGLK
jgi:hypothetical protein